RSIGKCGTDRVSSYRAGLFAGAMLALPVVHPDSSFTYPPELNAPLAAAGPQLREVVPQVFACSDFVAQSCVRHPAMLSELIESGDLLRALTPKQYAERA